MPNARLPSVRTLLWLTALLWAVTLAWDATGRDLAVMQRLGDAQGFALRDAPLWRHWGHDVAQQLARGMLALLWLAALLPWTVPHTRARVWGRQALQAALGATLALLLIGWLKHRSLTSCPWDLELFGGTARYVSHWQWGVPDGGGARCFPGGHVASAAIFWSLALVSRSPRARRALWLLVALLALAFGAVQTLRGAHYPSHTLWTMALAWTVVVAHHAAWRRWGRTHALGVAQTSTSTASP